LLEAALLALLALQDRDGIVKKLGLAIR